MNNTLSFITPGDTVTIDHILDGDLKPKLMELGLIVGKSIKVLFTAPFGDPIAVDVGGYVLSLRLEEARMIQVSKAIVPV